MTLPFTVQEGAGRKKEREGAGRKKERERERVPLPR
jgi:hypothetical protein